MWPESSPAGTVPAWAEAVPAGAGTTLLEAVTVTVLVGFRGVAAVMVTVLMGMGRVTTLGAAAAPVAPVAVMVTVEVGVGLMGVGLPGAGTVMVRVMLRWVWVTVALVGRALADETTAVVESAADVALAAAVALGPRAVVDKASVVVAGMVAGRDVLLAVPGAAADVVALVKAGTDDGREVAVVEFPAAVELATGGAVDKGTGKLAFDVLVTGGSTNTIHLLMLGERSSSALYMWRFARPANFWRVPPMSNTLGRGRGWGRVPRS